MNWFVKVSINPADCVFDTERMMNIIAGENIRVDYSEDEDACEEVVALAKEVKKAKPLYITIARKKNRDIHYAV